jgi:hypothetical protein
MLKITKLFTILAVLQLSVGVLIAQDAPEFSYRVGGTVQSWTSLGEIHSADTNSFGWGLRRVRLRAYSKFGDKMKGFIQMELTSPKLLDARIEYLVSKAFTIRAGRFIGAGVRSGGLTSHTVIDITERPYSAVKWGSHTIGADYRDYGLDFVGKFGDLKANVTLHNGSGSTNIRNRQTGSGIQNGSFAVSGMLVFKPKSLKGLEAGGYYGMGNSEINEYNSFNAYVYYEPKPLRVKAEVISWTNSSGSIDQTHMGYYVFAGYGIAKNWEAVARFEIYDNNTDLDDDQLTLITVGATHSIFSNKWAAGKITAAYTLQSEADAGFYPEIDNNVFQLVMQLVF